jgi:hypothetical protein
MRYLLMFAAIAAVVVSIEVIGGHRLSASVVFLALCVAVGGTVGIAYRRQRHARK